MRSELLSTYPITLNNPRLASRRAFSLMPGPPRRSIFDPDVDSTRQRVHACILMCCIHSERNRGCCSVKLGKRNCPLRYYRCPQSLSLAIFPSSKSFVSHFAPMERKRETKGNETGNEQETKRSFSWGSWETGKK